MKLVEMTVEDFSKEVDSNSPAPGGGSVSALASNIGVSLARMMTNLSFGKKKYESLDEEIRKEFTERFNKLGDIREELLILVDKDTESFDAYMKALKMPKETDEEKIVRKEAIKCATEFSIEVPFKTASISLESLKLLSFMAKYGNQNAITDIGVGTLLIYTGIEGAILNVKVNLLGLDDESMVSEYTKDCNAILNKACEIKDEILGNIHNDLNPIKA
ncbi:formiminotetrahydrofolate cyclodeaminase [Paraclostridium bifermentans]|uniref:cyclodeaminase/cyclohydrolase family protein n=1 Tax=Paraclostridium bifermentans TaxID=1490 RepID=UPI0021C2AFC4|nr:cyclodeaminase/cyclohydrolase family protein [Paraclostridium bifermentans]GKZ03265.1 formiminotetrahydrofolate cyclodeaminase [Paraclostridium bifermentans]GKZ07811.1 formiminotetrahydrofolate cyclodeaminase [Paraclostridium bifermentans]GKZ09229.1 formiminotetrahydrofolate cyclodeaminase [Paraclostridium bifermentans]